MPHESPFLIDSKLPELASYLVVRSRISRRGLMRKSIERMEVVHV